MMYHLVSEEAFLDLSILRDKTEVVLGCILDDEACAHVQTLADIAGDYLSSMRKTMRAMQENRITAPP